MIPDMSRKSSPVPKQVAITQALLRIVAERGLEEVSVREVAADADVSIGTVQHYFPTKDTMLAAAYKEVLRRIRARIEAVELRPDIRANLSAVLAELLPLDQRRRAETRIHLAFAARAATMPALAAIQREALSELHGSLTEAFALAWAGHATRADSQLAAHAAIAAADGLALHAASSAGWLTRQRLRSVLELTLDAIMAIHARDG
jgi:AcrR family transcriptional regulator